MAASSKNKRDKPPIAATEKSTAATPQPTPTPTSETGEKDKPKRLPANILKLQFAGDIVLVKRPLDDQYQGLFKRYETLFEALANMSLQERIINYKFLNALMLTGHARRTEDVPKKRQLFDLKNELYFDLARNRETRRLLSFRYLTSKRALVLEYCPDCVKRNEEAKAAKHAWVYCDKCKIDKNFFNVLAMHHKFQKGAGTMFISNEMISKIEHVNVQQTTGERGDTEEELVFTKYHYTPKHLDAFDVESVLKMNERLKK